MVKLHIFASLAVAASVVSAHTVDITFQRYSQQGCSPDDTWIGANTHLHNPHCKTFDEDEPAFYSFFIKREEQDPIDKYCKAIVHTKPDCVGNGYTWGDMNDYVGKCVNATIPGRSVRIKCRSSETTTTGTMPTTATTWEVVTAQDKTVLHLFTSAKPLPTTTVTLVPQWDDNHDCEECSG